MKPFTPKYTITDMQELAAFNGGRCLSEEYWDLRTKLAWQCEKGHTWDATHESTKQGHWCPQCTKAERRSFFFEKVRQIAKKRGGKCLSKKYFGSHTKLKWQCKEGHIWETIPASVKNGHWCPVCGAKRRDDMLRGNIEEMHKVAEGKGGKCLSKNYINRFTKLKWQCNQGHVWEATALSVKNNKTWCPYCAKNARLTIKEMHEIAQKRGGKCLSEKYINENTKLKWQCKEGHTFNSTPLNVKAKHWCPVCARKSTADKQRGTIEQMQKIAKSRGGKCLSVEYINHITKLKWQCKEGHKWEATAKSIKRGRWCPVCKGKQ